MNLTPKNLKLEEMKKETKNAGKVLHELEEQTKCLFKFNVLIQIRFYFLTLF